MKIKSRFGKIIDLSQAKEELNIIDVLYSLEHDVSLRQERYEAWVESYGEEILGALVATLSIPYDNDLGEDASVGWEMFHEELHSIVGDINPKTGRTSR